MQKNSTKVAGARRKSRAQVAKAGAADTRERARKLLTTAVAVVATGTATNTGVSTYVVSERGEWVFDTLSFLPPLGVAGVVTAVSFGASVGAVWLAGLFGDALGAVRRR